MMSFGQAVKSCFNKYITFTGRATRAEYWWFQLFLLLLFFASVILGCIAGVLSETISIGKNSAPAQASSWSFYIMIGFIICFIITFLPTLSVMVRRFHDVGIAGWLVIPLLLFAGFTAGLGSIIIFVISLLPSKGGNKYGDSLAEGVSSDSISHEGTEKENEVKSEDVEL